MTQGTIQGQVKNNGSSGELRSPLQRGLLKALGGGGQIPESLENLDFIPETWGAIRY